MLETTDRCTAYLKARQPGAWSHTLGLVRNLGERLEGLSPVERARVLDRTLWDKALSLLSTEDITAVVNRHMPGVKRSNAIRSFADSYALLTTAVLVLLGAEDADDPYAALTLLLSDAPEHQAKARAAILADHEAHEAALIALPGYAFFLLARFTNDGMESFMARDAFWTTMLGRPDPCG